jgi:translation elongation factor EF-Tu-like GTPase
MMRVDEFFNIKENTLFTGKPIEDCIIHAGDGILIGLYGFEDMHSIVPTLTETTVIAVERFQKLIAPPIPSETIGILVKLTEEQMKQVRAITKPGFIQIYA